MDIRKGDARNLIGTLKDGSVSLVVTSPPYYRLNDWRHPDQLGLEPTPELYLATLSSCLDLLRPKMAERGKLVIIIGNTDSCPTADLMLMEMLCGKGWLRVMKLAERKHVPPQAGRLGAKLSESAWVLSLAAFEGNEPMPSIGEWGFGEISRACLSAYTHEGDLVCDPFGGTHELGRIAERMGRRYIGFDVN